MIAETNSTTAPRNVSRRRLRLFKALAIVIGLAIALIFVEAALRILEKRSLATRTPVIIPDARLGIRVASNAPGHDAKGFRNAFVPSHADVVALGDSQTWGVNVQAPDAWPQQLGKLSGRSVYNMAVGGYGPDQYLLLVDQALELSPKTIVVGLYFGNDLYDAYAFAYKLDSLTDLRQDQPSSELSHDTILSRSDQLWNEEKNFHNSYGRNSAFGWSVWLREHTAIGRLLNRNGWWFGSSDIDYEIDKAWAQAYPDHGLVCNDDHIKTVFTSAYRLTGSDLNDPRVVEGLRITKLALIRMRDKGQDHAKLIVLMIPTKELVYAEVMKKKGSLNGTYAQLIAMETRARIDLMSWCHDNQIKCIDALPALQSAIAAGQQIYPTTTESHPNAAGYRVIAGVVNDELRASAQ